MTEPYVPVFYPDDHETEFPGHVVGIEQVHD